MGTEKSSQKAPDRMPRMSRSPEAKKWRTDQLLSMAARVVERRKDQALAALGLTNAAVIALQGLAGGPLNQEQLARRIAVQSQSLGRVLARLEDADLVSRIRDQRDRRQFIVALTPAGNAALASAHQIECNALPAGLEDSTTLQRDLARILTAFEVPGRF